jgi:hypothetical protein
MKRIIQKMLLLATLLQPILVFGQNSYTNFFDTPVAAQQAGKKVKKLQSQIKLNIGSHMLYVDGPIGGDLGFGYEGAISKNWTLSSNLDVLINEFDRFHGNKRFLETRISVYPEIRFYPYKAHEWFFTSFAMGFNWGRGESQSEGGVFLNPDGTHPIQTIRETFIDLRFGWQQPIKSKFYFGIFAGAGLVFPLVISDFLIIPTDMYPMFKVGLQIGRKNK